MKLTEEVGKEETLILLSMKQIKSLGHKDWMCIKQINKQMKLKNNETNYFSKLSTKNVFQENRVKDCQAMEELRRICCEERDRARQVRIDAVSMQQEENPSTVNQLLAQILELQDKVNSLNDAKEFYGPQTTSSPGMSHVPWQPLSIPSRRGLIRRDSCLPHDTRNSMGSSGNVF